MATFTTPHIKSVFLVCALTCSLQFVVSCGGESTPSAPTSTPPAASTPAPAPAPAPAPPPAPSPAPSPAPAPAPAPKPPSGPRTSFGNGQWLVGADIAAGRYFADPASGCYWERQRGLGGSL